MDQLRQTLKAQLTGRIPIAQLRFLDLAPFLAHSERQIEDFIKHFEPGPIIKVLPGKALVIDDVYSWLSRVIVKILDPAPASDLTVDDIAKALLDKDKDQLEGSDREDADPILRQVAVAMLGWTTSLFSWHQSFNKRQCAIHTGSKQGSIKVSLEQCRKTIDGFVRYLSLMPTSYKKAPVPEDLLYLSILNFYSLTHIGRLRIKWVSHISQHLVLRIPESSLSLFKFPSVCVLALLNGDYQQLKDRRPDSNSRILCDPSYSIHREVLLSLRFILGQTRKSRRLSRRLALSTLVPSDRDAAFEMLLNGQLDWLLLNLAAPSESSTLPALQLVGRKDPRATLQEMLTPWTDLPLLGERMLELQRYNAMQQPTKTRKMIRDKRDPVRWYTLWAVLILGGIGVVLSALQLGLSAAQLAYAIKPPTGSAMQRGVDTSILTRGKTTIV